ncbi:MAG: hypothetical protein IJI54_06655 [Kiritimatiellae bacterium]|nr:hypothetical protein [Kiritimatiellia bacterium]
MKKSIVAMLSITALATVANAEVWEGTAGTPFEADGMVVGGSFFASDNELGTTGNGTYFWYAATNGTFYAGPFGVYTNADNSSAYSGTRPAIAGNANTTSKYLSIDTEGERLYRRFGGTKLNENAYIGGDNDFRVGTFTQYDVTSTIYFDSLVQFTVNEDEAPTIQTGDKLAVWLQGGETTNLVVTAGYLDPNNETPLIVSNYVTTASVEPGTWHRLTIEAYNLVTAEGEPVVGDNQESGYLGFRVRIDGQLLTTSGSVGDVATFVNAVVGTGDATADALAYAGNFELFPSLTYSANQCTSLSCIAFEGTGAVDDLTFTDTNPFPGQQQDDLAIVIGGVTNFFTEADVVAFTNAFKAGNTLVLPAEGWSFSDGQILHGSDVFATVPGYYNVVDGAISLNETIVRPVFGTKPASGEDPAVEPITVGADTVTLNITNGKAGLYYGVRKYTALGGESSDTWNQTAQTADGNVTLEVPKDATEPAAFYQVIVNDVLPAGE